MNDRIAGLLAGDRSRQAPDGEAPSEPSPLSPTASIPSLDDSMLPAAKPGLLRCLSRDRLLLVAFAVVVLLIAYQVGVTIADPVWLGPVTDWLRAALAVPEFLIVAGVSRWLSRTRHPAARSWWMWSAALLSYVMARVLWTVCSRFLYPHGVPFPSFPDLFFVLQYPFFILATIFLPRTHFWGSRLILILDGVLVIGAATALSWNFILAPLYLASGISSLARTVILSYPVGDLFVLFGLTMTLLRPGRYQADRLVLEVLVPAVVCLIVADSWAGLLLLPPPHMYRTGNPPDVFWLAFYLLVPLAALCQLRLTRRLPGADRTLAVSRPTLRGLDWRNFSASVRFFFPIVLAFVASIIIVAHATLLMMRLGWRHEIVPFTVSACLLSLTLLRQELSFLEIAQLRREAEYARASEQAMRELNRRKDEFLSIISHELKTPLACLQGYLELLARRFAVWRPAEEDADVLARNLAAARTTIQYADESLHRIARLVDDLLDDAQIHDGQLAFRLATVDLGVIVRRAVEEQELLTPDRTITLAAPAATPVPVVADASRIAQVVANYLTNALKYSKADRPVAVRLAMKGDLAYVSVRDEGIGVPLAEQANVWQRFHVIGGDRVQSGSGVSLGIGLYISRSIIVGHHGQVGVQSVPGQGATFWFTLPLAPPAP